MTKRYPKISYGHGFLEDGTEATSPNWDKTESNMTLAAINVINDDVFDMLGTATGGSPYGFWTNHTALGLSTNVYTKIRIRYKVSGTGCRAQFKAQFNGGSAQMLLSPGIATEWTTFDVTLTSSKTLDFIELQVMDATGHLYVDFVVVYKGDFTFPNANLGTVFWPTSRYIYQDPLGGIGQMTQNLGGDLAQFQAHCDLDIGTWTRSGLADLIAGEVFLDICHKAVSEPWQWLDTGSHLCKFKATLAKPEFQHETKSESEASHTIQLHFYEYRRGPANDESYGERFGLIT